MHIGITGHTSGIGQFLYNYYLKNNVVMGFSRSNGYDIANKIHRNNIINDSLKLDVFINNATSEFNQSILLSDMYKKWNKLGKSGVIISIGSRVAYDYKTRAMPIMYDIEKLSLYHTHESLCNLSQQINLTLLSLGYVENKNVTEPMISMNDISCMIDYIIKNQHLQFRHIVIEAK